MTKQITNKQFVSEVARIMGGGMLFQGDISKSVLLEKLERKYKIKICKECKGVGRHRHECSEVGDHPLR